MKLLRKHLHLVSILFLLIWIIIGFHRTTIRTSGMFPGMLLDYNSPSRDFKSCISYQILDLDSHSSIYLMAFFLVLKMLFWSLAFVIPLHIALTLSKAKKLNPAVTSYLAALLIFTWMNVTLFVNKPDFSDFNEVDVLLHTLLSTLYSALITLAIILIPIFYIFFLILKARHHTFKNRLKTVLLLIISLFAIIVAALHLIEARWRYDSSFVFQNHNSFLRFIPAPVLKRLCPMDFINALLILVFIEIIIPLYTRKIYKYLSPGGKNKELR